ncbi:alpha/beta hydrolase [Paenibacillus sp. CAU 1782]
MNERVKREEWFCPGLGDIRFFAREWKPVQKETKAVIALSHGQGEYGERYSHVAERLSSEGYVLLALDHYGHGRSGGKRGHMPSYEVMMDHTELMLEQCAKRYPGLPVFLYGHSMGGNIALNYSLRFKPAIQGLLLTSPWLQLAFKPPAVKEWIGKKLSILLPALPMATGLKVQDLYREGPSFQPTMRMDEFCHTTITPRAYTELQTASEWAMSHAGELDVPLLLLHGTDDRITSFEASRQLAGQLGARCEWKPWPGGLHELHNDLEGAEMLGVVTDWIHRQL